MSEKLRREYDVEQRPSYGTHKITPTLTVPTMVVLLLVDVGERLVRGGPIAGFTVGVARGGRRGDRGGR